MNQTKKKIWFLAGVAGAMALGAFANIPRSGSPTGSMAITPEVSEMKIQRQKELSFDNDLKRLSAIQGRYRENLPRKGKATKRAQARKPHKSKKL